MESKTIVKRLLSGSILRTTLLACNIGVSFFMMPFLIHSLGDRLYGFWTLVGAFMGYYGFLDLGLSSAVTRYVSRAYGQKNYNEMNTVINTSLYLFSIIGLITIIISFIAAFACPLFIKNQTEITLFKLIIIVLGFDVAISFPMRAFAGVLSSKLRYDLTVYIQLGKLILRTSLIVYFIQNSYGLLSLAIITFSVNIIAYFFIFYFVKKEFRQLKLGVKLFKKEKIKTLFTYSKYTFITQIADHLRFKIDSFIIAGFLGLNMVTIYFIASRLVEYFVQLITNSMGLLIPVFSQFEGRGDFKSIRKIFLFATKLSATITFFVGGSIIFYGKYFIYVWMGPEYNASYPVLVILCTATMLGLIQNPSIGLLYGISKHKFYAISNTCEGALNLVLSLILVQLYGIYGVAMGTLIEMIVFKIFVQPVYSCRVIKIPVFEYYVQAILLPLIKLTFPMLIFFYFAEKYIQYTYLNIFLTAATQVLVFLPIIYYCIIGKKEREFLGSIRISQQEFS